MLGTIVPYHQMHVDFSYWYVNPPTWLDVFVSTMKEHVLQPMAHTYQKVR